MPPPKKAAAATFTVRPYGPAVQEAIGSGDLKKMKAVATAAKKHISEHGDVAAALEALKIEIAKLEGKKR